MVSKLPDRPSVWLAGEIGHPEFSESLAIVRTTADVGTLPPEVVVIAQHRPGVVSQSGIERLRREAPLAGIVALLGSWCEGETRTGRPAAGATRLYWYEFPSWWRRQMALRAAGNCPDWAQPSQTERSRYSTAGQASGGTRLAHVGRILIDTYWRDTADTLFDVLGSQGYSAVWQQDKDSNSQGVVAGIWDGAQLDCREVERLAAFCKLLEPNGVPVVALLDFPRRDRCEAARDAGAAVVLGKPWSNSALIETLRHIVDSRTAVRAA